MERLQAVRAWNLTRMDMHYRHDVFSAGLSHIEAPTYPDDRERWAGVLADNQWTISEIKDGTAWKTMN